MSLTSFSVLRKSHCLKMPEKWRTTRIVTVIFSGILLYGFFDPVYIPIFPRCPFYVATGFQCPGCGSQRALHYLLHGNFGTAWHYNAGLLVAVVLLAFICISSWMQDHFPQAYRISRHRFFSYGVLFLFCFWWIFRNL